MKFTSVRLHLTLWNIGILAVVLFGSMTSVMLVSRASLLSALDHRLLDMSERQVRFFAHAHAFHRPPSPPPNDSDARPRYETNRFPRIFNLQGQAVNLDGTPDSTLEGPWDHVALARAANGAMLFSLVHRVENNEEVLYRVISRPLNRDGRRFGVLQVAVSFSEMQTLLTSLTNMLLFLVPCALILAGLCGLLITNRALQPVRQITRAAKTLNSDNLSQRLPIVGADEFADLVTTMNGMLGKMEVAFGQLQQSVQRERQFTADASHELRTPLTAIKANATLYLNRDRTPAEYQKALRAINQAATLMTTLVQDLLLLARSDNGQLHVRYQDIDIATLCQDALALTRVDAEQAPVRLLLPEAIGTLWGDPSYLQRLLMNVLENALRHTPPDGEVTLAVRAEPQTIIFEITDTGEGIAPDHLPHLGERFYRVDDARARRDGGTGLGLSICRSIVATHHGALDIHSTPGQGTCVTIRLPNNPDVNSPA